MTNIEVYKKQVDEKQLAYSFEKNPETFYDLAIALKLLCQAHCEESRNAAQRASQIANDLCSLALDYPNVKPAIDRRVSVKSL